MAKTLTNSQSRLKDNTLSVTNLAPQSKFYAGPINETPSYLRPTASYANSAKIKKKVVIKEDIYREPKLEVFD